MTKLTHTYSFEPSASQSARNGTHALKSLQTIFIRAVSSRQLHPVWLALPLPSAMALTGYELRDCMHVADRTGRNRRARSAGTATTGGQQCLRPSTPIRALQRQLTTEASAVVPNSGRCSSACSCVDSYVFAVEGGQRLIEVSAAWTCLTPTMRPVCVDSSSGLAEYRLASSVVASGMAAAWVGLVRCGLIPVRSLAAILSDCGCDSRALHQQAFCALTASPGARAYYNQFRGRGQGHHAALRQLSNRLVGILHGRLKTGTLYDEQTA